MKHIKPDHVIRAGLLSVLLTFSGYAFLGSPLSQFLGGAFATTSTVVAALAVWAGIHFNPLRPTAAVIVLAYCFGRGLAVLYDGGFHPAVTLHWVSFGLMAAILLGVLWRGGDYE